MTAFKQVVGKLQQGNREEALIGLEFVLRLDPAYAPAKNLHQQLSSGSAEIDLNEVLAELQARFETESGVHLSWEGATTQEGEDALWRVLRAGPFAFDPREDAGWIQSASPVGERRGVGAISFVDSDGLSPAPNVQSKLSDACQYRRCTSW